MTGWSAAWRTPAAIFPLRSFSGSFSVLRNGSKLLTTVAFEIEREHAVQARGSRKNLRIAKRAYGIVIARTPMILHRQTRKLVILGVTLVISSPIDQVDDVVDLVAGDR